jgi:hypothetical protein
VLAAGQDRAARALVEHQQLALRIRAGLLIVGALERLGQQRVPEHVAVDALGIQRVGLAALAAAIGPRRAVRADVADVMAASAEEDRGVSAPAAGVLHAPARDRPERARPRLKRAVALARDAEMRAGHQPTARVDDRGRQRALMRIDPDHVAGVIGREQQMRGPGAPALASGHHALPSRPLRAIPLKVRTGRQHPGGRENSQERSYQVKPILDSTNRGRHFVSKTPPRV